MVMGFGVWVVVGNLAGSPALKLIVAVTLGVAIFAAVAKLVSADELKDLFARRRT